MISTKEFLETIFENQKVFVSYRPKDDRKDFSNKLMYPNQVDDYLASVSNEALDTYISRSSYQLWSSKRSYDNLKQLSAIVIDLDLAKHKMTEEDAMAKLKPLMNQLPPTAIVKTGHGLHLWFKLKHIPANGAYVDDIKALESSIALYYSNIGADSAPMTNLAGLMRLPNTFNYKDNKKLPVTCVYLNKDAEYTRKAFKFFYEPHQTDLGIITLDKPKTSETTSEASYKGSAKIAADFEAKRLPRIARDRLSDLTKLVKLREGDLKGYRHNLLLYVSLSGGNPCEVNQMLKEPFETSQIFSIINWIKANKQPARLKTATILAGLSITDDEASQLRTIKPSKLTHIEERKAYRKLAAILKRTSQMNKHMYCVIYSDRTLNQLASDLGVSRATARRYKNMAVSPDLINTTYAIFNQFLEQTKDYNKDIDVSMINQIQEHLITKKKDIKREEDLANVVWLDNYYKKISSKTH